MDQYACTLCPLSYWDFRIKFLFQILYCSMVNHHGQWIFFWIILMWILFCFTILTDIHNLFSWCKYFWAIFFICFSFFKENQKLNALLAFHQGNIFLTCSLFDHPQFVRESWDGILSSLILGVLRWGMNCQNTFCWEMQSTFYSKSNL